MIDGAGGSEVKADVLPPEIVSAARYAAETSRRPVTVAIEHRNERGLGPTHIYTSRGFETAFGWQAGRAPWQELRTALRTAAAGTDETWVVKNRRDEPHVAHAQRMDTGFAAIVLVVPESRGRWIVRKLLPASAAAARASQ